MQQTVRIWDLPTRLFHWSLVATTVGLVVTAKVGGAAMVWHLRLAYVMLTLLLFRVVWGLVGGRWSRFTSFVYSPARLWRYVRGKEEGESPGHSPLGALSVFALLTVLLLQEISGMASDDEIAFTGPLARFLPGRWVGLATWWHKDVGQYVLYGIIGLHLLAIVFYVLIRRHTLVRPMLHGDKQLPHAVPASRDDAASRALAAVVLAACGACAWWVSTL